MPHLQELLNLEAQATYDAIYGLKDLKIQTCPDQKLPFQVISTSEQFSLSIRQDWLSFTEHLHCEARPDTKMSPKRALWRRALHSKSGNVHVHAHQHRKNWEPGSVTNASGNGRDLAEETRKAFKLRRYHLIRTWKDERETGPSGRRKENVGWGNSVSGNSESYKKKMSKYGHG